MKSGGLGSLPKGLDWINQEPEKVKPEIKKNVEQAQPVPQSDSPRITAGTKQKQTKKPFPIPNAIKPAQPKALKDSALRGLPSGYTRATFIIKQQHVDRLKAIAYVNKTSIKDLVDQAMNKFLKNKDVAAILMEAVNGTANATSLSDDK